MNIENKVKVVICGKEYNLRTDEKPEYIKGLADRIDKEIGDMVKAKPNFGIQNAAIKWRSCERSSLRRALKISGVR